MKGHAGGEGLLLGIDLGTSGSKGVLCRPNGEVVAETGRSHETSMPHPGWVEHDAEEIWWKDFTEICAELLDRADEPVVAVCTSGIGRTSWPAARRGVR